MNPTTYIFPCLGSLVLMTTTTVTAAGASVPPEDCIISPCYWHFGDADTKIEVTGLDKLKGLANAGVTFTPIMQGNPCIFTETAPWVVSDSNPDPENGCQDRIYWGEFQFDEEAECQRERGSDWGESSAQAMGIYRLWAQARAQQISINFDKIANNTIEAGSGANTIRGGKGESGIRNDDDFLAVIVPFTVEVTTLPVQLKLRATFMSTYGNEYTPMCYDKPTDSYSGSWNNESRLWGGCGVWVRDAPANSPALAGLNEFAGSGFGSKAIVLDESNPSVGILTTDAVDLPPGDYEVRYWVHSYSQLSGSGDWDCSFAENNTDAHVFQAWLNLEGEKYSADLNGDGTVEVMDFSEMLINWDATSSEQDETWQLRGDINGDGTVNIEDFSLLLIQFGSSCNSGGLRRF